MTVRISTIFLRKFAISFKEKRARFHGIKTRMRVEYSNLKGRNKTEREEKEEKREEKREEGERKDKRYQEGERRGE